MPDATEWLVEHDDPDDHGTAYERFPNLNDAILFLHKVIGSSQRPRLYREMPITLKIDVGGEAPVKAPRKRRKNSPPADKPGSDTPTGPGNGEAGEPKGAAPSDAPREGQDSNPPPVERRTVGTETFASPNLASPVYDCEARLDSAPPCPGPIHYDTFTRGRFCSLHMPAIPFAGRLELHRRNHARNRLVRVAHVG